MLRFRDVVVFSVLGVSVLLATACSKATPPEPTFYQELDLKQLDGLEVAFDPNTIVDDSAFADTGADSDAIQLFFQKTPYDRPSFLETYRSNGLSAAEAIARAARQYRISPLVFLVFAQTAQGLVGERDYPSPPERVEYAFDCGCYERGNCAPELAGFDKQVDCLGRALRVALDQIDQGGSTTAGWGPNKESTTLDNRQVSPTNPGTAVVYDRTPYVAEGAPGGSWLFWNVMTHYAAGFMFFGGGEFGGGFIGDPCESEAGCGFENAACATDYPGGLCTSPCDGECPSDVDLPASFCAAFPEGGFCLAACEPSAPTCREGYRCVSFPKYNGAGEVGNVCFPESMRVP